MFSLVSRRVTQQNVPTFVLRAMSSVPSTMKVSGNGVADVITLAMAFFSHSRLTKRDLLRADVLARLHETALTFFFPHRPLLSVKPEMPTLSSSKPIIPLLPWELGK
jgi:hypothetical protein